MKSFVFFSYFGVRVKVIIHSCVSYSESKLKLYQIIFFNLVARHGLCSLVYQIPYKVSNNLDTTILSNKLSKTSECYILGDSQHLIGCLHLLNVTHTFASDFTHIIIIIMSL